MLAPVTKRVVGAILLRVVISQPVTTYRTCHVIMYAYSTAAYICQIDGKHVENWWV